jgi:hypothetical protein
LEDANKDTGRWDQLEGSASQTNSSAKWHNSYRTKIVTVMYKRPLDDFTMLLGRLSSLNFCSDWFCSTVCPIVLQTPTFTQVIFPITFAPTYIQITHCLKPLFFLLVDVRKMLFSSFFEVTIHSLKTEQVVSQFAGMYLHFIFCFMYI